MDLNQSTLRGILAQITSVNQANIVPKQGNWWNPQEQLVQPDTWCAYLIRTNPPRTVPFYNEGENGNQVVTERIATIDLQFVGPQAEAIAQSVALWPLRSDVAEQFKTVNGALLNDEMDATSSIFYQSGTNTVLAWNTTIRVMWIQKMDINQARMPALQFSGDINK